MSQQVELLAGERQNGESRKAIQACNDWLRLGPGRSLSALARSYNDTQQNSAPTRSLNTLQRWSADFDWQSRAETYDAELEQQKNERKRQALETGLALDYERVIELKRLADFLRGQVYEQGETGVYHNVWVPDVKQIGGGEFVEKVDIERYNSAIIDNLRGVLDDLAKETGGRKQGVEHSGPGGGPIQFTEVEVQLNRNEPVED